MNRRHIKWLPIGAALLFIAYQYFTSEKFVNPETGRKSHVALSVEQESALGLQSYQQILAQSQTIDSGPDLERIQRVVQRLAARQQVQLDKISTGASRLCKAIM
jgi:hypothetical protein